MEVDAFIMCNNNINNSDHEADISEARPLGLCLCLCCVFPFTVSLREASAGGTRQVSLGNHQGHWVCQKKSSSYGGSGQAGPPTETRGPVSSSGLGNLAN